MNQFLELPKPKDRDNQLDNLLGEQRILKNATMFCNQQTDVAYNASLSRKRIRSRQPSPLAHSNLVASPGTAETTATITAGISTSLEHQEQSQWYGSSANVEINALIHLQNKRLRLGLEEARKRHCRALLALMKDKVVKRLTEKETELESARRRNAELEQKLRQMVTASQVFFNIAKNNEAVVSSLRATIGQALLMTAAAAEGYGESKGMLLPTEEAQSCCFEEPEAAAARGDEEEVLCRRLCRVCRESEVCVVLLPCRHLCLCRDCECKVDVCPVCHSNMNASLQISMS